MSKIVSYLQQKTLQTDTIKQADSTGKKKNFQETLKQDILSEVSLENEKSTLVKKIEQGYDATTYIYSVSGDAVPLTGNFLNPSYFNEININKKNENLSSSISDDSIKTNGDSSFGIEKNDILLLSLILLLALIGFVKISGKNYLVRIMSSILNFSYSHMLYSERNKLFQLNDLVLLFVFYISTGLLLVSIAEYFNLPVSNKGKVLIYLSFIGITFVLVFSYKLIIRLIGAFLSFYKVVSEHLFYFNNILKLLGIFNIIMLFGILFAPENIRFVFIFATFFIYIIAYLTRALKIISDFLANQFSLSYLILYFCALEIIPILIIGNLFLDSYQNQVKLFYF